ncbi:hypothetical protein [Pseudoalteromonas sp. NJ631]|uniref:hypothetical protein n=1 Tax=Pseudoalteromonas sp. NJ631 TaxID=493915 RepID=UPI0002E3C3B4|nr:hypothetical protein [Pseudoalteromonas sp. NJ631]
MDGSASQQHNTVKKAALFSFNKLIAFTVFITSIVIGAYATDLVEIVKAYVLYSGSSLIRFIPILVLSVVMISYLYYQFERAGLSTFRRFIKSISTVFVCAAFFSAGMFLKDPWISLSMFNDEYDGPVKTFQHYAGFEVKKDKCEKRGKNLTCSFYAINLLPRDNAFRIRNKSYAIDHKDSQARLLAYYVGEKRYGSYNSDYFTVPVGSKRMFKMEFELSSDEKMVFAPYLSVVLDAEHHEEKHLNFRSMDVVDYVH